ncbi:MAG TPA: hypothetical protein VK203_27735 [Nostocaceae cyanobacterium]|nr:hypothetical protein [Nostocaceae cyanobacterium]
MNTLYTLYTIQIDFYTERLATAAQPKLSELGIFQTHYEDWTGNYEDTDPAVHLYGFWYKDGNPDELEKLITQHLNEKVLVYVEECSYQLPVEISHNEIREWVKNNVAGMYCASIYKRPSELYGSLDPIEHFLLLDTNVDDYLELFWSMIKPEFIEQLKSEFPEEFE